MYDSTADITRNLNELKAAKFECAQIIGTLDTRTCKHCALLDGAIIKVCDAIVGQNIPPFHEGCRCCLVAFSVEIYNLGIERTRIARNPSTRQCYYVPANWTFLDWYSSLSDDNKAKILPEVRAAVEAQVASRNSLIP